MDNKSYRYQINGKTYILKPLVLGQIGQITHLLQGIEIASDMGTMDIIKLLDDRLPVAIAIVLTEEGKKLKDKDVQALTEEVREFLDIGTAMEIVDRFFSLNPIASVLEKLTGTMMGISRMMTGSKERSSSSPEETSRGATGSSGDSHQKSVSRSSRSNRAGLPSGKR